MIGKSINTIVRDFIDEREGETLHSLRRFRGFAIDGVREIHMDKTGAPTATTLKVDDKKNYIDLPKDCIAPLVVGMLLNDNRLIPLHIDDNMLLIDKSTPEFKSFIFDSDLGKNTHYFDAKYLNGGFRRHDVKNNRIVINSNNISNCIYLEYLADIEKIGGDYFVPAYQIEYVKAWIRYVDIRSKIKTTYSTRQLYKEEMLEARDLTFSRATAQTIDDLIREVRKTQTGVPRI